MRIKNIGTKITIPIVLIILVGGAVTIAIIHNTFQKTLIIALKEKGMSVCKHLAVASLEPILIDDRQYLQQLLEEKKRSIHDISYAFITDEDDNILAHTFSDGFPLHLLWANRVISGQESSVQLLETEEGLIHDVAVPIMLDDKMIGAARVGLSQNLMKAALTKITAISIVIILSVLVVGILTAIGLTRLIVKPIKSLHHSTEVIETGNLEHRIVIKTGDEIEQLANSFNKMVAGLKEKSDELQKSEAKYRTLVESSPDMIHLIDAKGGFLSVNQVEAETLGYSLKEFSAMELKDIISLDHIENTKNAFKIVKEKGRVTYETELISKDGRKIPVEVNAIANYDMGGNFISALGILRDITERKRAEEALRESENRYRTIFENTGTAMVIIEEDTTISLLNTESEKLFGYSKGEVEGKKSWAEFIVKDDLERMKEYHHSRRINPNAVPSSYECRVIDKQGDVRDVFLTIAVVPGTNKSVVSALDITERKRTEEALRESEARYRILFESAAEGIVIADIQTKKFQYANPAICRMLGYSVEELIGKSLSDIHPEEELEHVISEFEAQARREKTLAPNIPCKRADGTIIYADINTTRALIDGRECNVGFFRDITARKRAEEELRKYREHLEDLVKERTAELTHLNEQLKREITERVEAEKALRESEEKFRTISVSAQDAIIMMDNEGEISFWNEAAEKMFGYSRPEALGQELHLFLAPQRYYEAYRKGFGRFKITGQGTPVGKTLELVAVRKDGTEFPIELSLSALNLKGAWNAIGIVRDITERKQAEEALRQSEEKYRSLVANIPDVTWTTDLEGNTVFISPNIEKIYGFTSEEIYQAGARLWLGRIHPDDVERVKEAYELLFTRSKIFDVEYRIRRKDGHWIWLHDKSIVTYEKDAVMYADGVFSDITERMLAEEALRESRYSLAEAQRIAHLGNWDWNIITGRLRWSDEIYRIFGLQPQEFGATYDAFLNSVHPDDRESVKEAVNKSLADPNVPYNIEHRVVRPDGSERIVHEQGEVIFDDTQKPIRMVGTVLDVTERVRTEEALQKTQAQLAQSEKMASLGMLVAGVAHEINTPVGAISSMHNTLVRAVEKLRSAMDIDGEKQRDERQKTGKLLKVIEDANRVITSATERVSNIVKRLKSFARLDEAELKTVDIHEGIEDTLTMIQHELKHKAVVERNFGDIPPIPCYPSQLNQVYLNLLMNAVQAIEDKGKITITTFQKDNQVHIQIKDTGVGIPKDALKKIFDPGYTTKGGGVGTGLGLSICYRIVKDHHGEIMVESEVGNGSTFTVILPMIPVEGGKPTDAGNTDGAR